MEYLMRNYLKKFLIEIFINEIYKFSCVLETQEIIFFDFPPHSSGPSLRTAPSPLLSDFFNIFFVPNILPTLNNS